MKDIFPLDSAPIDAVKELELALNNIIWLAGFGDGSRNERILANATEAQKRVELALKEIRMRNWGGTK